MNYNLFILLFLSQLIALPAPSQQRWSLKKDKEGIRVYTRPLADSKFDELKVECVMEGRISQLAAVLLDINKHPQWVYNTKSAFILNRISGSELYFYTEINSPWPIQNRDLVVHVRIFQDSTNKKMTVETVSVPGYVPVKGNIVRVPFSKVTWIAVPLRNNQFKIEYNIQLNPGGSVPAWLINLFSSRGPYESFSKLKERIKLPEYKDVRFPFIID